MDIAPIGPGCYIFKDRYGYVMYVGKSKSLRKRVRQYFTKTFTPDDKLYVLAKEATDVEYRETASELDALMLEFHLIKQYRPWFNTQLKRDRKYLYIKLDVTGEIPAFSVVYDRDGDARYYGSFRDKDEASDALRLFGAVWKIPTCGRVFDSRSVGRSRSCLEFHMGKCLAPCEGDSDAYRQSVKEVIRFFDGRNTPEIRKIRTEMKTHARALDFEKAARCKALLDALEKLRYRKNRSYRLQDASNVAVLIRPYGAAEFSVFYIRDGAAVYRENYRGTAILSAEEIGDGSGTAQCLSEIYADKLFVELPKNSSPPKTVELPEKNDAEKTKVSDAIARFASGEL